MNKIHSKQSGNGEKGEKVRGCTFYPYFYPDSGYLDINSGDYSV